MLLSFVVFFILFAFFTAASIAYVYKFRSSEHEMHGMMSAMIFGSISGFIISALCAMYHGDFLFASVAGVAVGVLVGIPLGRVWCPYGRIEGAMAGVMSGLMGAMFGQMARPYSIQGIMPFLAGIAIIIVGETLYAAYKKHGQKKLSMELFLAAIFALAMLASSFMLEFQIETNLVFSPVTASGSNSAFLPSPTTSASGAAIIPAFQNLSPQVTVSAKTVAGGWQEAEVEITRNYYTPSTILAKQGIPLKLTFKADHDASCVRDVVFPTLGLRKLVAAGGTQTFDISTANAGEIKFSCAMDMAHGKIIVSP